ncbi:glutathione S-transferase family protein [Paraburkholderia sp.]|uniref:glutathione S-transferase family protein n=1 Tax=Paraburkholderia sp. TaxID=1926495 RepID=UPI0039E5C022
MKLIGMLDSPYVRRVAICMKLLGLDFEHESISVFRTYDQFAKINPVVKAPTLIADNGTVLMDSTVILQYLATLAGPNPLFPTQPDKALRAARLTGLALSASEKSVQIVYERNLRPADRQHEPWVDRVRAQLLAAYAELERELAAAPLPDKQEQFDAALVAVAVAWNFTHMMLPELVGKADHPQLEKFSTLAESLPVFLDTPAE